MRPVLLATVALAAVPLGAQTPSPRPWQPTLVAAAGWTSPNRYVKTQPDHKHGIIGIKAARRVVTFDWFWMDFTPAFYPLVAVRAPDLGRPGPGRIGEGGVVWYEYAERFSSGAGITPIAAEFGYDLDRTVGVFAAAGAGVAWFGRDFPAPDSGRFDELVEIGAGVRVRLGDGETLAAGYRHHRLSSLRMQHDEPTVIGHLLVLELAWNTNRRR